jgi:hypothetical protein
MVGYGILLQANALDAVTVNLNAGAFDRRVLEGADMVEAEEKVVARLTRISEGGTHAFCIGAHCSDHFCRPARCHAHARSVTALLACPVGALADLPPETVGELHHKLRAADALVAAGKAAIKEYVRERGSLDLGDGTELAITQRAGAATLDNAIAPKVLLDFMTREGLMECASLSWAKCKDWIAAHAGRGEKKAAMEAARTALEEAGAITVPTIDILTTRKKTDG